MAVNKHLELATDVILLLIDVDDILIIGLEVTYLPKDMHFNQHRYIHNLLSRIGMVDTKLAHIPRALGKTLSITNGDLFSDNHLYYSIVGALQYVTFICPDISFVLKRILRYLKGTSTHGFLSMRLLLLISMVIRMQTRLLVQMTDATPVDIICF
ncbi:hypothetical protein AAG906_034377 [Vitis piasezkii]